jgi:hypothetical protein
MGIGSGSWHKSDVVCSDSYSSQSSDLDSCHFFTSARVLKNDRFSPLARQPFITPLHKANNDGQQSLALLRESVTHTPTIFRVLQTIQDVLFNQPA